MMTHRVLSAHAHIGVAIVFALVLAIRPTPAHAWVEGFVELMKFLELLDRTWLGTADKYDKPKSEASACTLITAYIPKERLCFDRSAYLGFHQAHDALTGKPNATINRMMFSKYPTEIRNWLIERGGLEKLPPPSQFWILFADKLWEMGYRECEEEAPGHEPPVPMTIITREEQR
jgi:hypothetical protein